MGKICFRILTKTNKKLNKFNKIIQSKLKLNLRMTRSYNIFNWVELTYVLYPLIVLHSQATILTRGKHKNSLS